MKPGKAACALAVIGCLASTAQADDGHMSRVLACVGADARMEVYLPQSVASGRGVDNADLKQPAAGFYALDLSDIGKGKSLEPVRVSLTPDRKSVVVDQYTRGLPPTTIPVAGGTVDFDQRFGTQAKCGPFNDG
jgi:hypothetical protein